MDFGRYELVGLLGSGGMGQVFLARDKVLRRQVALKVLTREVQEDATSVQRFLKEAQLAAGVSHPNVVVIHDFGTEQGRSYLAMEYLVGVSLKTYIERKVPLSSAQRIELLLQIARGLEHAHQKHIVHRDIKPANIQILPNGEVKILDFGIAKVTEADRTQLTETGMIVGTPGYASPEQVRGFPPVTVSSDVFSFGVVIYELMSGRKAFSSPDLMTLLFKIVYEEPAPLQLDGLELNEGVQALVTDCLKKSAEDRPASMTAVIARLRQIQRRIAALDAEAGIELVEPAWLNEPERLQTISPDVFATTTQMPQQAATLTNTAAAGLASPQGATRTLNRDPILGAPTWSGNTAIEGATSVRRPPPARASEWDEAMATTVTPAPALSPASVATTLLPATPIGPPPGTRPGPPIGTPSVAPAPVTASQPPLVPAAESPLIPAAEPSLIPTSATPRKSAGAIVESSHKGFGDSRGSTDLRVVLERRISGDLPWRELNILNTLILGFAKGMGKMMVLGSAVEWLKTDSKGKRILAIRIASQGGMTVLQLQRDLGHAASRRMTTFLVLGTLFGAAGAGAGWFLALPLVQTIAMGLVPLVLAAVIGIGSYKSEVRKGLVQLKSMQDRLTQHVTRVTLVE